MNKRFRGLYFLVVGVACCLLGIPAIAVETADGVLKGITGDVEVRKRGSPEWIEAENGMQISPGDVISTGITGKAMLFFRNSETKILPLTQFVLGRSVQADSEMYTELYLLSGKVSSHVIKTRHTGIKNKFQVITPTAVVGVRGTIQTVEYNPGTGTQADIRDGKGFAAPLPIDKLPPAVLELLGIEPKDTYASKPSDKKEGK